MSYNASLRQMGSAAHGQGVYTLSSEQITVIGREPNCQIILDSNYHQGVSRRHLEIRPIAGADGSLYWEVSDLGSSNGTYVNGQRLDSNYRLQDGDRLTLSNSTEFIFELIQTMTVAPPLPSESLSLTQLLPIVSVKGDARLRRLLIPGTFTVILVVLMFFSIDNPLAFIYILGIFLGIGGYYVVYQLCGKHKPWWLITAVVLFTIIFNLLLFGIVSFPFRYILPGNVSELIQQQRLGESVNPLDFLIRMFFGAGLCEEFTKAIPVFICLWLGKITSAPLNRKVGVWEPLDGIILAAASALGFTLDETLFQYVPNAISEGGVAVGIQLLIPRIVGSIAGHMAYSGYFGYFIGLAALKPRRFWRIIIIGYLTSSVLHALWNSVAAFTSNEFTGILLQTTVGIASFAFLIAAILKARQLSPTRSDNFATRL